MADWALILLAIIGGFILISGLGVHVAVAFLLTLRGRAEGLCRQVTGDENSRHDHHQPAD